MQKQKSRDPTLGYAKDFVPLMERLLPELVARKVRVTTNAGRREPARLRRGGGGGRPAARLRRQAHHRRRDRGRPAGPGGRAARGGTRAAEPRHRAPAARRARPAAVGQRLPRCRPRGRGVAARRRHRDHGPRDRHRAHAGADDARVRLGAGRVGPRGGRHGRRPHDRVRRAMLGRELPRGLGAHSRSGERGLSHRRSVSRRDGRHHQTSGHRWAHHRGRRHRAAGLRDGRPAQLHHARRHRRLHDHPAAAGGERPRADVRDPRPAGHGLAEGVGRLLLRLQGGGHAGVRLARRLQEGEGGRPGAAAAARRSGAQVRDDSHRVRGRGRDPRPSGCAGDQDGGRARGAAAHRRARRGAGAGRAVHAGDRPADPERTAQRDGIRGRPAEARGDRGVLAGADRQDPGPGMRRPRRQCDAPAARAARSAWWTSPTPARATRGTRPTSA